MAASNVQQENSEAIEFMDDDRSKEFENDASVFMAGFENGYIHIMTFLFSIRN